MAKEFSVFDFQFQDKPPLAALIFCPPPPARHGFGWLPEARF
jgi:hypothetical protein